MTIGQVSKWTGHWVCRCQQAAPSLKRSDTLSSLDFLPELPLSAEKVINPLWREADKALVVARKTVRALQAKLGACTALEEAAEIAHKAACLNDLELAQAALETARAARKALPRQVTLEALPVEQRPTELLPLNKMLCDAVKMVAYRAETVA